MLISLLEKSYLKNEEMLRRDEKKVILGRNVSTMF